MRSLKVIDLTAHAEPQAPAWQTVPPSEIELVPAPLEMQPNGFIRAEWAGRSYGETPSVEVRSVHDGARIALRLSWAKDRPDTGGREGFPDGAAIALPVAGEPALWSMGGDGEPVEFIQWRALRNEIRAVHAWGIGTSVPAPSVNQAVAAGWSQGRWTVVVTRDLAGPEGSAHLAPGSTVKIGFAIWNGSNEERAGIKAVALDWTDLEIEA